MASSEPLSWLKPGGSGRDHRPLCAALTTRATPSALSGPTRRPFCKRPTLTRADRRPTKGGRQPPAPRGLVLDGLLIRRLQGGLPPRPGTVRLAYVEQGGVWIHEACQQGREEVALGTGPTGTGMPALGAGFLLHAATVAGLGESCPPGIDVHDGPASTSSQAGQAFDKHPRRAELDRLAIGSLPGPIGEVFQLNGIPHHQQSMGQLPVAARAGGRQLPVDLAPPRLGLALTLRDMPAFLALPDASTFVIVPRVIGAALPVEVALQPSQRLGIGRHLGTEGL